MTGLAEFSSLSESGFIPTNMSYVAYRISKETVLISFREWLHSYLIDELDTKYGIRVVLISFREWLHSYLNIPSREVFDSLTEELKNSSHLFQRVASFLPFTRRFVGFRIDTGVLISFREWLHSYSRLPRLFIHALSGT